MIQQKTLIGNLWAPDIDDSNSNLPTPPIQIRYEDIASAFL
jgi:hypothetical protein